MLFGFGFSYSEYFYCCSLCPCDCVDCAFTVSTFIRQCIYMQSCHSCVQCLGVCVFGTLGLWIYASVIIKDFLCVNPAYTVLPRYIVIHVLRLRCFAMVFW